MQGMNTHISTWNLEGSAARSGRGSQSAYVWKTVALSVTANSLLSWCDEVRPDQEVVIRPKFGPRHGALGCALDLHAKLRGRHAAIGALYKLGEVDPADAQSLRQAGQSLAGPCF